VPARAILDSRIKIEYLDFTNFLRALIPPCVLCQGWPDLLSLKKNFRCNFHLIYRSAAELATKNMRIWQPEVLHYETLFVRPIILGMLVRLSFQQRGWSSSE
jgi:hypothetical protein